MNLEKYWRVLSNPETVGCEWYAYDNGWLSYFDGDFTHVFTPEGKEFLNERIKEIVSFENGYGAVLWREEDIYQWKVYANDGHFLARCPHVSRFLPNGLAVLQTPQGGTSLFNPLTNNGAVFLDEGQIDEIIGYGNHVIYGQKDKKDTVYTLCEIKDDKIVKKQSLEKVRCPHFFANGNYSFYTGYENEDFPFGKFQIFNRAEQLIFSANLRAVSFSKNHFLVYDSADYDGVYSAETGKRVYTGTDAITYFESGAYDLILGGFMLAKGEWEITENIRNVTTLGSSGALFRHQIYTFVIDTDLSVAELRERAIKELNSIASNTGDILYARYLVYFLTLLY